MESDLCKKKKKNRTCRCWLPSHHHYYYYYHWLPCTHFLSSCTQIQHMRGSRGRCVSNTHILRAKNCHQLNFASSSLLLHRASCLWLRKNRKDTQIGVSLPVDDQSQEDWVMPWFLVPKCQKSVTCTSRIQPQMSIGRESVSSNKPACVSVC